MSRDNRWVLVFAAMFFPVVAHAAGGGTVVLGKSIREVASAPPTGPINPHRAFITRRTLTAMETGGNIDFEVALKMRDFTELQARVGNGEQISLSEMASKYQPSAADYQSVVAWLKGQGFQITRQDDNHLGVFARGTVNQVQQAMALSFARVQKEGNEYTSAITAPHIPATLGPIVLGITGLQPHLRFHRNAILRANSTTGTNPPYLPSQLAQAYNATPLYTSNITGAGQTIAIIIDSFPLTSDLTAFWSDYGVNQSLSNIQLYQVVAGMPPGPVEGEESLDVEWSSSIAPGAQVRVYGTPTLDSNYLDEAYGQVYTDVTKNGMPIHQMSMSYGGGEMTDEDQDSVEIDDQYFAELASAGVTVLASAGDGAATPGDASAGDTTGPLQVESPASDPFVTGVGGTSLVLDSSGNESSESIWNNGYGGGGGGVSSYFGRPSWQVGPGVPAGSARLVPDLACSADPQEGAVVVVNGSQVVYGGTSWSSPTVAGFCALLNQSRSKASLASLGLLGPRIYPLIGSGNFRDITAGNNATANSNGLYPATAGYDEASGIGVPLVQALSQTFGVQAQVAPLAQSVVPGQSATVTVTATGTPAGYQWQQMPVGSNSWSNLADGGNFTGSNSATLTVSGTTPALSGDKFKCLVTYLNPSVVANTPMSVLIVSTPLSVATLASGFNHPIGVVLDSSGNLYIADSRNNEIRKFTPAGTLTTVTFSGSPALSRPEGIAIDSSGQYLYVADTGNGLIREITLSASGNTISTLGTSASPAFSVPTGVAVDGSGNVYVADSGNDLVREITASGAVNIVAGTLTTTGGTTTGTAGYVDGPSATSQVSDPTGLALDGSGNLYVADDGNDVIRKISAGVVSTVAGQASIPGDMDGVGTSALFDGPNAVAVDGSGNLYVTDSLPAAYRSPAGNNLLRKITPAGVVSTLAGKANTNGSVNGTGAAAEFYSPQGVAVAGSGEVYIADTSNSEIRVAGIAPVITTQPMGEVVTAGQTVTFSVAASGIPAPTYQWQEENSTGGGYTSIPGATGSTYQIPNTSPSNTGSYEVVVANAFGSVTSSAADLVVSTAQPVAQTVSSGNSVTFSIAVSSSVSPSYQYLFNGTPISGATQASYTITDVTAANAGSYSVIVSDNYGTVTSSPVTLTVTPPVLADDSPTLPQWGLIALAGMLVLAAAPRLLQESRA